MEIRKDNVYIANKNAKPNKQLTALDDFCAYIILPYIDSRQGWQLPISHLVNTYN